MSVSASRAWARATRASFSSRAASRAAWRALSRSTFETMLLLHAARLAPGDPGCVVASRPGSRELGGCAKNLAQRLAAVEAEQHLPALHLIALADPHFDHATGYARHDLHGVVGFDASDVADFYVEFPAAGGDDQRWVHDLSSRVREAPRSRPCAEQQAHAHRQQPAASPPRFRSCRHRYGACRTRSRRAPLVRYDAAIGELHDPFGERRNRRVMRDDDQCHARGGQLAEQREDLRVVVESRAPVGSSASSRRGWLTRARAMATRCC